MLPESISKDRIGAAIAETQTASGAIPWERGRYWDPWNMVEAAMGLDVSGRHEGAKAAFRWLARNQRSDGAWAAKYRDDRATDTTLDSNLCAYPAVGVHHHVLATGDIAFAEEMWPTVEAAIGFVLDMQAATGEIAWARDGYQRIWPAAIVTSASCIYLSLGCAVNLAERLGFERPDWELARTTLGESIVERRGNYLDKRRFSMDWYYPALSGVVTGDQAREALARRWDEFVVNGLGVRCVSDRLWITSGETCELAIACARVGWYEDALSLIEWIQHLRSEGGGYWTGATFPDGTIWPREATTWSAGAMLLAFDVLQGGHASSIFGPDDLALSTSSSRPAEDP